MSPAGIEPGSVPKTLRRRIARLDPRIRLIAIQCSYVSLWSSQATGYYRAYQLGATGTTLTYAEIDVKSSSARRVLEKWFRSKDFNLTRPPNSGCASDLHFGGMYATHVDCRSMLVATEAAGDIICLHQIGAPIARIELAASTSTGSALPD